MLEFSESIEIRDLENIFANFIEWPMLPIKGIFYNMNVKISTDIVHFRRHITKSDFLSNIKVFSDPLQYHPALKQPRFLQLEQLSEYSNLLGHNTRLLLSQNHPDQDKSP